MIELIVNIIANTIDILRSPKAKINGLVRSLNY